MRSCRPGSSNCYSSRREQHHINDIRQAWAESSTRSVQWFSATQSLNAFIGENLRQYVSGEIARWFCTVAAVSSRRSVQLMARPNQPGGSWYRTPQRGRCQSDRSGYRHGPCRSSSRQTPSGADGQLPVRFPNQLRPEDHFSTASTRAVTSCRDSRVVQHDVKIQQRHLACHEFEPQRLVTASSSSRNFERIAVFSPMETHVRDAPSGSILTNSSPQSYLEFGENNDEMEPKHLFRGILLRYCGVTAVQSGSGRYPQLCCPAADWHS